MHCRRVVGAGRLRVSDPTSASGDSGFGGLGSFRRSISALVLAGVLAISTLTVLVSVPSTAAATTPDAPRILGSIADPAKGVVPGSVMGHHALRRATSGLTNPTAVPSTTQTAQTAPDQLISQGGAPAIISAPPKVYLVLWGSQWGSVTQDAQRLPVASGDALGAANYLARLYAALGTANETWSGVMTQYCTAPQGATLCASSAARVGYPTGGALAGWWADTSAATPSVATANQVAQEAQAAALHFANTSSSLNADAQYVILSPTGTHPEGFAVANPATPYPLTGACADHSFATSSATGDLAYTDLPYVSDLVNAQGASLCGTNSVNAASSGTLDGFSVVAGHEYAETLTDTLPGAGWVDVAGQENGDKCAWTSLQDVAFATGSFAMQPTWSNDSAACAIGHAVITATPPASFSLTASPTQAAIASPHTPVAVSIVASSSGTDTLDLSVQAPSGFAAALAHSQVQTGQATALTLATDATVVAGNYDIVVTATSRTMGIAQTIDVPATVTPGTFSVSMNPAVIQMTPGTLATAQIQTQIVSGAPQWLYFSLMTPSRKLLPAHAYQTVTQGPVVAGQGSTQEFWSDPTAKPGTYHYTFRAMSAQGVVSSVPVTLQILAPPLSPFVPSLSSLQGNVVHGSPNPATVLLKLKGKKNSAPPAAITIQGLPGHVTGMVASTLAMGASTPLTFSADAQATPGLSIITITCSIPGGATRSVTYLLYVS